MSKVAVVYWSGTGNTEAMATSVADGVKNAGGEATVFTAAEFDASMVDSFDAVAFGCPRMDKNMGGKLPFSRRSPCA